MEAARTEPPNFERTRNRVRDALRCFVLDCSASGWLLRKWSSGTCTLHHVKKTECECPPPYSFYPFPSKLTKQEEYEKWLHRINRKQSPDSDTLLQPSNFEKVCSNHFVDGKPTTKNPFPSLSLGYDEFNRAQAAMYLFDPDLDPKSFASELASDENDENDNRGASIQPDHSYVTHTSDVDTEITSEPNDSNGATKLETNEPKPNSSRQEWNGKKIVKSVVVSQDKLKLGGSSIIVMNVSEAVKCRFCEEKFASDELWRSHVFASHKEQTTKTILFNCCECDRGFRTIALLANHLKGAHGLPGGKNKRDQERKITRDENEIRKLSNQCNRCHKKFFNRRQLERHQKDQDCESQCDRKAPVFDCEYCEQNFPSENLRMCHMMAFHREQMEGGPFKCPHCDEECSLKADLARHLEDYHPELECKYCEEKFSSERFRMAHMFSCHKQLLVGNLYRCPLCTKGFPYEAALDEHRREEHRTVHSTHCEYCEAKFPTENLLLCHMIASHPKEAAETTHECRECGEKFLNRKGLAAHMKAGHPITTTMSVVRDMKDCKLCDKKFTSETLLLCHMFGVHKDEAAKSLHKCPQCNGSFRFRAGLTRHLRQDHDMTLAESRRAVKPMSGEPKSRMYACMECDLTFPTLNAMKTHEEEADHRRKPTEKQTSHLCDQCGKLCKSLKSFRAHSVIHTGEKNHACKICDERFSFALDLWHHRQSKHDERPPQKVHCDVCGKGFLRAGCLKIHQKIHNGEKPFACETCGKGFVTVARKNLHLRFAHKQQSAGGSKQVMKEKVPKTFSNENVPKRPKLMFECLDCGSNFASRSELNNHALIHTSLKIQFQCEHCFAEFADKASLAIHMRSHQHHIINIRGESSESKIYHNPHSSSQHEETQYECPVPTCRKTFSYLQDLTVHQASHTDDKPWECSLCRDRFRSEQKLRKHASMHDGLMVKCNICPMKFNGRVFLKKHLKKHDNGVLCDICGQEFALRENLIAHRQAHGDNDDYTDEGPEHSDEDYDPNSF